MKYSELHRKIRRDGWNYVKAEGSHYTYEKNGREYSVPYHGSKEVSSFLARKILKEMEIK